MLKTIFGLTATSIETRYEYIDGHVRMLAGGTINHATVSVNIGSILRSLLRGSSCRVLNSDVRVRLSETRYVYPDVSVSCDARDQQQEESREKGHVLTVPQLKSALAPRSSRRRTRADREFALTAR